MGLNPFPQRRTRLRLTVEELHARTVPAMLSGLEGEFVSDTEEVFVSDELAPVDPSLYESGLAEFTITSFDESAPVDLVAEGEGLDEVPVFKGEGNDDFVIMPYYRTLTSTAGDVSEEVVDETLDPDAIFWTFGAVDGEAGIVTEEYVKDEAFDPDSIFWTFGGVAEEGTSEAVADGELVDPIPEEWLYMTMGAPEVVTEEIVNLEDGPVLEDVLLEEPTAAVDPLPEEWMFYTMGGGLSAEPVADETEYDPAVCEMAKNDLVAKGTEEVDVVRDETDGVSIFTLDDFVGDDATAETEDVEVTTEVVTEPDAVPPTPVLETAKLEAKPLATDYFSLDGDTLDYFFGAHGGGKKKK